MGPNERSIGVPGGRAELDEPALCIDLTKFYKETILQGDGLQLSGAPCAGSLAAIRVGLDIVFEISYTAIIAFRKTRWH